MSRLSRPLARLGSLSVLVSLAALTPAHAFVQARKEDGKAIVWQNTTCVGLTPDMEFNRGQIDNAQLTATLQKAATNWSNLTSACSFFSLQILPPRTGVPIGYSSGGPSVNLIKFVAEGWSHDPGAAAITTVTYSDLTGRAFDADIELNSQYFLFGLLPDSGGGGGDTDLENTLTHEYGHLMGLDHTCDDGLRIPTPTNDQGQAIPKCCPDTDPTCLRISSSEYLEAYPDVIESTMFNFAQPGEVRKRSPEPDDVRGLCAIYPANLTPGVCHVEYDPDAERGCQMTDEPLDGITARASTRSWALVLFSLLVLQALRAAGRRPSRLRLG